MSHAPRTRASGAPSSVPIHLSSFYLSEGDPSALPYAYGRHGNPTWDALEAELGALERANALVFASGQAAAFALMMALGAGRPRLLVPHDGYYGTRKLAEMLAVRGVEPIALDFADLGAIERALAAGPAVLWAETPTNPFLRVFDLAALARLAKSAGAPFVVDNTTATAALQQPLALGADATVCSLTKSTSGHSDVLLGSVATRDATLLESLRTWRANAGGIAGPFECWVALRGLKTLELRIARQSETALAIAQRLAAHRRVRRVHYPGTESSTLAIARAQMRGGFGPLLSFELDGSAQDADRVVAAARTIRCGTSFGGVESSWERRARWTSESAPPSLIRLSIGLEPESEIAQDLERALG